MALSSSFFLGGGNWGIEGPVPRHGEQDVAAPSGESDRCKGKGIRGLPGGAAGA